MAPFGRMARLILPLLSLSSRDVASFSTIATAEKKQAMEAVVRSYFRGVDEKNPDMIRSCFGESATIRDVCGLNDDVRSVPSETLVERCMEFVTAHPDVKIDFHYGPECGRDSNWVVAHWYEIGTWSGESCGIAAPNPPQPMTVEGQTRFRVCPDKLKIEEFVVTRTFTEWEQQMLKARASAS